MRDLNAEVVGIAERQASLTDDELLELLEYEWERAGLALADRGPGDYLKGVRDELLARAVREQETVGVVTAMIANDVLELGRRARAREATSTPSSSGCWWRGLPARRCRDRLDQPTIKVSVMNMTAVLYPSGRGEAGLGPPPMRECLELALVDGEIHSLRHTPGRSELVKLAAPDAELERYRLALARTARREDPPDEQFRQRIRELTRPLQAALQQAVPSEARERMALKDPGSVRRLVSIELTLNSAALEIYPWELIAIRRRFARTPPT